MTALGEFFRYLMDICLYSCDNLIDQRLCHQTASDPGARDVWLFHNFSPVSPPGYVSPSAGDVPLLRGKMKK
ncbi:hypothetical protein QQ045_001751 [Rhodiola kirilowii]